MPRGIDDMASHCITRACMRLTQIYKHCSTAGSVWTRPPDLWPVWAQVSAPLTHTNFSTVHLWYSAHTPRTSCRKLWPVRTRDWSMNVWSYLYRMTGQPQYLTFSHLMPHCGALSRHAKAALSNVEHAGLQDSVWLAVRRWLESQTSTAWSCIYKLSRL